MNKIIKRPFILCALILFNTACSKFTAHVSSNEETIKAIQQPANSEPIDKTEELRVVRNTIAEEVKPLPLDSIDVVAIPQEDEQHESIRFSDEQSVSIMLPEYQNMEIDDISLLLKEMNESDFHYPTANTSYVTSPYGWRHGRMHAGIDLKVYTGDDIYAVFDGVVRIARYYGAYGYCLVIRHYNGLETLYAHSSKLLVGVNDEVKAGQVIALGGSSGRSTGSHLHFEIRVAGNYINPNLVIDTKNHSLQDENLYLTRRNSRMFASNNDSAEDREAEIIRELSIKYHTVKSGDVLSRIAVNNHTTVSAICRLNHISSRSTLRIGQRLIVRDGIRPTTSQSKQKTTVSTPTKATYVVKSGDTLSAIARRNHTSVSSICKLNNITTRSILHIGQRLRIG